MRHPFLRRGAVFLLGKAVSLLLTIYAMEGVLLGTIYLLFTCVQNVTVFDKWLEIFDILKKSFDILPEIFDIF